MRKIALYLMLAVLTLTLLLSGCSTSSTQPATPATADKTTEQADKTKNEQPAKETTKTNDVNNDSPAPIEISFMHIHGGAGGELVNAMCEEFTNNSNGKVKVNPIFVEGSYEGITEKLQMMSLSNSLPEMTQAGHQYTYFMADNMPIIPAQEFIDKEAMDISDYFPKMIDLGRNKEGKILGLPFAVSTPVLYYNKEMFAANNIDKIPETFDEVREVAKTLTKGDNFGIYINYQITGNWEIQTLVENFGGTMLNADRTAVAIEETGLKAFEFINNLVNVDKTMPVVASDEAATQASEMWKAGKIGMYITTIASLRGFQKDCVFEVGTALHPYDGVSSRSTPAGGNCVYVVKSDEAKQNASWDFIKYITSPEKSTEVAQVFGYMTTSQQALETAELMGNYLKENPAAEVTYQQVGYMSPWCNFPSNSGTRYVKITQDNIVAMINGEKTPQQALTDTVTDLNKLIK